jgi:hypothetical protein
MRSGRIVASCGALALFGALLGSCDPSEFARLEGGEDYGSDGSIEPDATTAGEGNRESGTSAPVNVPLADAMVRKSSDAAAPLGPEQSREPHDASAARDGADTDVNTDMHSALDAGTAPAPVDAEPAVGDASADVVGGPIEDAAAPGPLGISSCYETYATRSLCDGFEAAVGPAWTSQRKEGQVAQSAAQTRVGAGALRASTDVQGGYAFVTRPVFATLTSGTLHLRSYLFVPSGVPIRGIVVHGLAEARPPWGGVSIRLDDSGFELDVHPKEPGVDVMFVRATPAVAVARDRWMCLQLEVAIGQAGSVRLQVDGQLAARADLPTLPGTGYQGVSAGIVYSADEQAPVTVWIDELVADRQPIPCD